jgi:hypothetical protein
MWFAIMIIALFTVTVAGLLIEELFPLWLEAKYGNSNKKASSPTQTKEKTNG